MKIQNIVKGNAKQMKIIAQDAIELIRNDATQKGIFQNDKGPYKYKNRQYKIYKNRGMDKIRGGGKLKSYNEYSSNAPDTTTSWVNMKLSGQSQDNMISEGKENQAIINYTKNGAIILYNKKRGYDIYDLRKKNLDIIAIEYGKRILDRNIKKYVSKTTTIK